MGLSNAIPNAVLQQGVCLSTSRPTNPYVGQTIYETDTGKLLVYYGATTGWQLPWGQPWGVLGTHSLGTTFSTSGTHTNYQATGLTVTAPVVLNRRIRVTWVGNPYPNGGLQSIWFALVIAGVAIQEETLPDAALNTGVSHQLNMSGLWTATTTGSVTATAQMKAFSANTQVSDFANGSNTWRFLTVEDIGPATATPPSS